MELLFLLSKEHPDLPAAESESLVKAHGGRVLGKYGNLLIAKCGRDFPSDRLVLSKLVCENLDKLSQREYKSFAVKVHDLSGKADKEKVKVRVAGKIEGKVDLEKPETVIHVFVTNEGTFTGRELYKFRASGFRERDVNLRPAFHPTSLQPKWARLLTNLAGLRKGQSLLDPFCGVGGILIESSLMGIRATGLDLDLKSVEGAKKNLNYYGAEAKVIHADFLEFENGNFDSIVTDIPYGRSSALFDRKLDELYFKSFEKMKEFSGKTVIMAPMDCQSKLETAGWNLQGKYSFRVHGSLTRHVHVVSNSS
jgi:tRNA (guanine10-N2)-dimethyltransferase